MLRGWIIGTLAEEAFSHVIGLDSSEQVWAALKEAYAQSSQERQIQLTQQLTYMKKTNEVSFNDYLRRFKEVCDSLAAISLTVTDQNKVFALLTGLRAKYEPFITSKLKPPMPSYNEIVPLLQSYETRLSLHTPETSPYTTFYTDKNDTKNTSKTLNHQTSSHPKVEVFHLQTSKIKPPSKVPLLLPQLMRTIVI